MKTTHTHTLCLIPESDVEHQEWEAVLAPYSWADGEFGMILTEAAFRQLNDNSRNDPSIPQRVRSGMTMLADAVKAGDYADVCLQHTRVSEVNARGKRVV